MVLLNGKTVVLQMFARCGRGGRIVIPRRRFSMLKLNKKTITLAVLMAVVPAAATAAEYNGLSGAFNVNSTAEDTNVVVKQPKRMSEISGLRI